MGTFLQTVRNLGPMRLAVMGGVVLGLTAPCVFDGPINGERILAYVQQALVPTLKPGDVVIMDILSSHKSPAIRDLTGFHTVWVMTGSPWPGLHRSATWP